MLAPLALVQLALPTLRRRRAHRQPQLGCCRRGVRDLGRLRLVQGRAGPPDGDPRSGEPGPARVRGRPGRHAHADAAGRVPRRGHLRPAAARGERSRPAGADRGRPAERHLPGPRARRGVGMSALGAAGARSRRTSRPRRVASRATACACSSPTGPTARIAHARFDDLPRLLSPGDLVVVNTSATLAAALPAIRNDGQKLELRLSTPVEGKDPERFWIVELRSRRCAVRLGRGRRALRAPRRRMGRDPRALRRRPALARAPRAARAAGRATSTSTAARSATATSRAAGRSRRTRTSTRSSPAAPRCRAPAGRSRRS